MEDSSNNIKYTVSQKKFTDNDTADTNDNTNKVQGSEVQLFERKERSFQYYSKIVLLIFSLILVLLLITALFITLELILFPSNDIEMSFAQLIKDIPYFLVIIVVLCITPASILCSLIKNIFKEDKQEQDVISQTTVATVSKIITDIIKNK